MNKAFLYLSLIVLVIATVLLFQSNYENKQQNPAEAFLKEIHSSNRYVSTDEIAKRIIEDDPTLFLVDVRAEEEFNTYSLPGAVNIPLQSVLNKEWEQNLNQGVLDVIFFSNDDFNSEEAWALCKQEGYSNLYVLEGGLNNWFSTIMLPEKPGELASTEELELFSFRTGASIYFGSGSVTIPVIVEVEEKPAPLVKKTIPVKTKQKAEAEGGC